MTRRKYQNTRIVKLPTLSRTKEKLRKKPRRETRRKSAQHFSWMNEPREIRFVEHQRARMERERRRLTVTSSISIWIINSFLLSFDSTISKETDDWHIIYWRGTSAPSNASNGGLKRILIHIVKARICNSSLGWQLSTRFSVREISTGFPFESSLVVMSFIETS